MILHDKIASQLPAWRERVSHLTRDHGSFVVADVTVEQIYAGIRDVPIQVTDISHVEPQRGVLLRGHTIAEILQRLPRAPGSDYPLAGGLYYLLLTSEMPEESQAWEVENEWKKRAALPPHVFDLIRTMPHDTHPMTLFVQGILALQNDAVFPTVYNTSVPKGEYWRYFLDDSLNLVAKLPALAAFIYNYRYNGGRFIQPRPDLDWSANFGHMIGRGQNPGYQDLCRLFFTLHSDHEGGNVSAHTAHLVCSALADIYLTASAALTGLAGPLHGLANQECTRWLLGVRSEFDHFPSQAELADLIRRQINAGKVIPGYGHAVLRTTDPRFTAQLDFADKHIANDELIDLVKLVYHTLPPILMENGKVKNPWPNVDAINGALQYHYGVTQLDFYTVLFGVSRILGVTAHAVWARALNKPLERPKSLTTAILESMIAESTG
jgi:citrate synthase